MSRRNKVAALFVVLAMLIGLAFPMSTVTVQAADFAITKQPGNVTEPLGGTAKFTVEASGSGLSYQWQWSANGSTWGNSGLSTAKNATLEVPVTTDRNGQMYRCVVTDASGAKLYSSAGKLSIGTRFEITKQPVDVTETLGGTAKFTVAAIGDGLKYQWQWSTNGTTWGNSGLGTAKSATLEVPVTADRNGQYYRCVVTNANGSVLNSNAGKLTVGQKTLFEITRQPENVSAALGSTAKFVVAATGDGLSYQWQWSTNGVTWGNSGLGTAKSSTLEVPVTADRNGQYYRCVVTNVNGAQLNSSAGRLSIASSAPFEITKQPENVTESLGGTAKFVVEAIGDGLSYQWQWSVNGITWGNSGLPTATSSALEVPVTADRNGQMYRCIITNVSGAQLNSEAGKLSVAASSPFEITQQPEDVTEKLGGTAKFVVEATGDGLSYQWQWSNNGTTWGNSGLPTAKGSTLEVPVTVDRNGQMYRCVVTNVNGVQLNSNAGKLSVAYTPFGITEQPVDVTANINETAQFSVVATGDGLSYQWQWSTNGTTWGNSGLPTATSSTLSVPVTADRNGQMYRCVITNISGAQLNSNAGKLSIETAPFEITQQPENATAYIGETAQFTVEAIGDGLKYQWQWSTNGTTWGNSGLPSATSATLVVPATADRNGQMYRCVVTNIIGLKLYSNAGRLTADSKFEITQQPQNVTATVGETAKFIVAALGEGVTYQWQWSSDGIIWGDSGLASAKKATLEVPVTADRNGQMYRCVLTNAYGTKLNSDAGKLTAEPKFEITQQPQNVSGIIGEVVQFTVAANETGLTYQWQWSTNGTTWGNSGLATATSATLEVPVSMDRNGQMYRCVVTNAKGVSVTSNAGKLTAETKFEIIQQPQNTTATVGETAKFTVIATGDGLTYQWQWSTNGTTWGDSGLATAKKATLEVPVTADRNGQMYRCVITNAKGVKLNSDAGKLTAEPKLEITQQPQSVTGMVGEFAKFTVTANGVGLSYQWQWSSNGSTWGDSGLATATSATLEVPVSIDRNGQMYRCIVTDAKGVKVTSTAGKLTAKVKFEITQQPQNITEQAGGVARFVVTASGTGLNYQWQWSSDGSTWGNSGLPTAKSATLEVPVTDDRNGQMYRCVVTNADGEKLNSTAGKLTVGVVVIIPTVSITASETSIQQGKTVTFTATAENAVQYQWYAGINVNNMTEISGATAATYTYFGEDAGALHIKCVVTSSSGDTKSSNIITVVVLDEDEVPIIPGEGDDCHHNLVYISNEDGTHTVYCTQCYESWNESCKDADNDGVCDFCSFSVEINREEDETEIIKPSDNGGNGLRDENETEML